MFGTLVTYPALEMIMMDMYEEMLQIGESNAALIERANYLATISFIFVVFIATILLFALFYKVVFLRF